MCKRQPSAATVMVVDVAAPARSNEALPFVWDEEKSRGWRGSIFLAEAWLVVGQSLHRPDAESERESRCEVTCSRDPLPGNS